MGCAIFLLSVVAGVAAGELPNSYVTGDPTKESCEENNIPVAGSSCGAWQASANQCRKGTVDNQAECVAKGHLGPILLSIACLALCCAAAVVCTRHPTTHDAAEVAPPN